MKLRTGAAAGAAAALALALALLPATAASAVPLPTGGVTGTIVDPSGNPVSGVDVGISSVTHDYYATTGADGAFSFPTVPAGSYRVGWYQAGYPRSLHSTVDVAPGDVVDLELLLPNLSEITVTVTDGTNPLEDAFVYYRSETWGVSNGPVFTDTDGVFSVTTLPADTYNIFVQGPQGSDFVSEWYNNVLTLDGATDVVLPVEGDVENFVIALGTSPFHLSGTVEVDGTPVEDASVSIYLGTLATYDLESQAAYDLTDATGAYVSQGLVSGTYVVRADWYDEVTEARYESAPQEVVIDDVSAVLDIQLAPRVPETPTVTTGVADSYATPANTVLEVEVGAGLLANDTVVPANDEFEVGEILTPPAHGQLFVAYDGALTYAPDTGFNGIDTFTYESGPEGQGSGAVTVTIRVGVLPATGAGVDGAPLAIALLALGAGLALAVVARRRATA